MGMDLDPKLVEGRRIRIGFTRYNARKRYYDHLKNTSLMVTVADNDELKRLMDAIKAVIEQRDWSNERMDRVSKSSGIASAVV